MGVIACCSPFLILCYLLPIFLVISFGLWEELGRSLTMIMLNCVIVDSTGISGAQMAFYNCPALSWVGWAFFIPASTGYWMDLPIKKEMPLGKMALFSWR